MNGPWFNLYNWIIPKILFEEQAISYYLNLLKHITDVRKV